MEKKYAKLSEVTEMTINSALGWNFKHWCPSQNKMLSSEAPQKCDTCKNPFDPTKGVAYQKRWALDTDHGVIEVSKGQLGQLLELAFDKREGAVIDGVRFLVGNNGKKGKDIRYWFTIDRTEQIAPAVTEEINQDEIEF